MCVYISKMLIQALMPNTDVGGIKAEGEKE